MTKSDHDLGCASLERLARKCDCRSGAARRVKRKAKNNIKRMKVTVEETVLKPTSKSFSPYYWRHPKKDDE